MTNDAIFRWSNSEGELSKLTPEGETILEFIPEGFKRNDLFYSHMTHWLKRIDNPELLALCSFEDAMEALRVVLCARNANTLQKMITI